MRVALAGTFGPIHDGHRRLFETALERGDEGVVVGVTSDALARDPRERPVPPHEERVERVREELDRLNERGRDVEVREITGEYGTATADPSLDALVFSPETAPELAGINDERHERGLALLEGVVVPYARADDGGRISSTRVVAGEIDEHGRLRDGNGDPD